MALVVTAEEFFFAVIASSQEQQVARVRFEIDHFVVNLVAAGDSDVEELAALVRAIVDASAFVKMSAGFSNAHTRTHAPEHLL